MTSLIVKTDSSDVAQVMEELGAKGPSVGRARAKMLDWQLANPTAGEAEALQWLRQEGKRLLD